MNKYINKVFNKKRVKRFEFFVTLLRSIESEEPLQILDLGGTEVYWEKMDYLTNKLKTNITILN